MKTPIHYLPILLAWLALSTINSQLSTAHAQGTAFTYQGRLLNSGSGPASGSYDLTFALFATNSSGVAIAGPVTNAATAVTNGLFTVTLDFGGGLFTGSTNRWLEIGARTNGVGSFTTLSPRQQITPTPYAIFANTAGNLTGLFIQQNSSGAPNVIAGSPNNFVAGGVVGATISGGGATNYFGYVYTNSVTADLGTVSGGANNTAGFVSTVGGGSYNHAGDGDATVGGGAANTSSGNYATVGGGLNNTASGGNATVGGGNANTASGNYATVAGGVLNTASGYAATVSSGYNNQATNNYATVPGGLFNIAGGQYSFAAGRRAQATNDGAFVWADSQNAPFTSTNNDSFNVRAQGGVRFVTGGAGLSVDGINFGGQSSTNTGLDAVVSGGYANTASSSYTVVGGGHANIASGPYATVGGGYINQATNYYATIGGGLQNSASGSSATVGGGADNTASGGGATVGGGYSNQATNNYATVPGGYINLAGGQYSFAAGRQAQATNDGAFVWADSQNAPFASTTTNQFSVRANGGVRLVTSGAGVSVDGQSVLTTGSSASGISIQQNSSGAPNVIEGAPNNFVAGGVVGATIGGGGATNYYGNISVSNSVTADFGTVGGGEANTARAEGATVAGGEGNIASGIDATVGGGRNNTASGNYDTTVGGGANNSASGDYATVGGGNDNTASGMEAMVPGGYDNVAGGINSFAAGQLAQATNNGTFVWADGAQAGFFNSTANNQFLIHAQGGVGINTNNPRATLDVNGSLRINSGTVFTNLQAGQAQMAGGSSTSYTNLVITFPKAFVTTPKVVATVSGDPGYNVSDTFVTSVRATSTTSCTVNIVRVDTASGWSQVLRINWIAWE